MKVKVGTFDILSSSSLLVELGKPIEIYFGDTDNLKLIFNLITDPTKEKFKSEARLINDKTIELDLINFVTAQGTGGGNKYPVKIGKFQNRALYYSFVVTSIGDGIQPLFHYTFYLGEEVANG
ncbi:MAG: hypothetical protein QM534_06770 [Sediminibacterium sp.]|nr:hypothetical protein [Sediminibacterium sp.]